MNDYSLALSSNLSADYISVMKNSVCKNRNFKTNKLH